MKMIIGLGRNTYFELLQIGRKRHPKVSNWTSATALKYARSPRRFHYKANYHHNYMHVGSFAEIKAGLLFYTYARQEYILQAPYGYSWACDDNGVHIKSNDGYKDYHPDSDDLREYSKREIRAKALANYRKRVAARKEARKEFKLIRQAQKEGAMIGVCDSLNAGNCLVGTTSFADRHDLDPGKHYKPTKLLKIMNGEAHLVKLAVASGLRRHRREMKEGQCFLPDHNPDMPLFFHELSGELKDRVLEENRYWHVEDDYWHEYTTDWWKEKLAAYGFDDAKIWFSGFSSQGDGACFDSYVDLDVLTNHMFYEATTYEEARDWRSINLAIYYGLIDGGEIYSIGNYSHENSRSMNSFNFYLHDCPTVESWEKLFEDLDEVRCGLCQEIYSDLEREYEYLTSEEFLCEYFADGDNEFDREGNIL